MGGSSDGFGDFVAARQSSLLRTAWLLTGNWTSAEDLVQTTLLNVLPRWERLSREGNPEAYAHRALVNTYLSWWRRFRRREQPIESLPEPGSAEAGYDAVVLRDQLVRAMSVLPPRQRAVVVLRYLHDYSEAETAALLGIAVGTVKSQGARGLAAARAQLAAITQESSL